MEELFSEFCRCKEILSEIHFLFIFRTNFCHIFPLYYRHIGKEKSDMLQEVSHLLMHKAFSYSWQAAMPSASPLLINLTLSLISYICYPLTKKSFARAKLFFIPFAKTGCAWIALLIRPALPAHGISDIFLLSQVPHGYAVRIC